MPTRRQTLAGMLALGFGSAAASVSAFTSSTEPDSDLRVVVESELSLVPARDPEDTPDQDGDDDPYRYVDTDDDGQIQSFEFRHLNKNAITEFADLASIVNNGELTADRIELSFTTDGTGGEITEALKIVVPDENDIDNNDDGTYTLLPGDRTFGPGDSATFGIEMDFLSKDVPDTVTLVIDPIRA